MTSTHRYDLVLFDLDGTLIETGAEIADATNDTLRELGLPAVDAAQVDRWIGLGTRELLARALAHVRAQPLEAVRADPDFPGAVALFQPHYTRRCGTRSQLYPHVRVVVDELRDAGVALAVVTNKEGRFVQRVLDANGLSACFDPVLCGDTLPSKKPDPAGVAQCLAQHGVAPARALFVGDSSIDVETARRAGLAVWALPYGYNMGQPIAASAPDRLLRDFSELRDVLRPVG